MDAISKYNQLLPALKARVSDFKSFGIDYISENDILDYLKNCVWNNYDLPFNDMISDVLNTPGYLIKDYILIKHKNEKNIL